MDIISNNYLPGDQRLIEQIVRELKSQGIFDQFRKECISDVDTKPAYQNLRQRVESSVSGFLTKQTWNPEMNKNQVREMLRKNIYESGFLETGVERIVDQVVNPKITTVFLTKVEDVVYKFLGLEKPVKLEANDVDPIKINSCHDLLPTDLEAVSPEIPEEKDVEIKDYIEDVKMEELSPSYEMLNEKKEKFVQEENSVDSSHSSVLSGIISNDSNHSQKQDSLMSLNSSESRMSLVISENTSKIEGDDAFLPLKLSHSVSKVDFQMDEKSDEIVTQNAKKEFREMLDSAEEITNENDAPVEKTSEDINSKLKDSINKKRERHHSSSEKLKSKSDKDRTKSDKVKKDEREHSKERKNEKEKYRIPKLSDKNKTDKVNKSKEKDNKIKERSDREKDKKSDKDKKSVKHSSEKDRSKSDSKSKKESKSDKKDREKDDRRERKDSLKNEKSKDERKSSSSYSSKQKESSSSKEKNREKDKEIKKTSDEISEKSKNGHSSSSSSSTKKDSSTSKYKRDEDKSRSSRRKDDKDDRKKKRSSKDDHYSSKEKKNGRRSSDRDSDGPPDNKILPITPQKNSEKYSQASKQDSFHSNSENSTDDTGNKDKLEDGNEESGDTLQLEMQKIKLPKFASNLQEAMKIMKIRKQLKKLENTNKLNSENSEVKKLLNDIAELSKDGKKDKREESMDNEKIIETTKDEVNENCTKTLTLDINDFISSSNISMAKWNALEAKFMEEMGCIDYDSYESPYVDEEESTSIEKNTNFEKIEKVLDKVKNEEPENNEDDGQEISHVGQFEQTYLSGDKEQLSNDVEETIENIEKTMEVFKNEYDNQESLSIVHMEKTSTATYSILDSDENNQLNSLEIVSDQPDIVLNSAELGKNQIQNESLSDILKSSKLPSTEAETTTTNYLRKTTKFEDCRRKAIVLLEKHSLTEELIKSKRNGKYVNQDSRSDNSNRDKSLETEKENIELNEITIVEKSTITETHSSMGNEVKSIGNLEKNHVINQDVIDKIKNSVEERMCENEDEILSATCNQNITRNQSSKRLNHLKSKKIFDITYQNRGDGDKTLLGENCEKEHEEYPCLGFEATDDGRILTILKCLIKSLEDNVCESIEKIKQLKYTKGHKFAPHPNKVEAKQDLISNNNLENAGFKRRGTHSPLNRLLPKKLRTEENAEKNTDIALENKFSLPLSPAESESEKRADTHIVGTKSRRSKLTSNRVEKASSTANKIISPPKNSNGKKSTRQRYSSEDLYKPRIYLRRTRNGPDNS